MACIETFILCIYSPAISFNDTEFSLYKYIYFNEKRIWKELNQTHTFKYFFLNSTDSFSV